jgi:preprotein translocase subunit SecG
LVDVVSQTNNQIIGAITNVNVLTIIGWILFAVICIGVIVYGYVWWTNKKLFNKTIKAYSIVNGYWSDQPYVDIAKSVKIGSGGFEIIYLKKLKTWKLAQDARAGNNTYEFYIMPDGYWYPARRLGNLYKIDEFNGYIPVVSTNPSMRAQYTSLEKQINDIHAQKKNFWEQYGNWILSIAFILIAGVMLWMNYKEYVAASGNFNAMADKFASLVDKMNTMLGNLQTGGNSGLVQVK